MPYTHCSRDMPWHNVTNLGMSLLHNNAIQALTIPVS